MKIFAKSLALRFLLVGGAVLGLGSAPALAQEVIYYHTDALGSPVASTDASGNVIERTEYEPYGKVLNHPLTDGPGYTGHVSDAGTGLSYMQQRYYDPGIGRFLSIDPEGPNTTTGWNFNRYHYAANNPYKFTDPDGRSVWTKLIKLAINGGNVAQTVAGVVSDARTVMDSNASVGERVFAAVSIISEAAPVSVGDVKDAAKGLKVVADKVKKSYYSREKRAAAHARADGKCEYCGKDTNMDQPFKPDSAEGDHFVPQSKGGETTDDNLVNSCRECNGTAEKGGKMPGAEWQPKAPNERVQEKLKDFDK